MPIVKHKTEPLEVELKTDEELAAPFEAPHAVDAYVTVREQIAVWEANDNIRSYLAAVAMRAKYEKEIRAMVEDDPGEDPVTICGPEHAVRLSPAAQKRSITDKGAVVLAIQALDGGDDILLDVIQIPLKQIDAMFSPGKQEELGITSERTGSRKIDVVS